MTLRAIHNRRNFFSDYWLGTLLSARNAGPRLGASELRARLRRTTRLVDSLGGLSRLEPARFRERFAIPLLTGVLDFKVGANEIRPQVRPLMPPGDAATTPIAAVLLCHDSSDQDKTSTRRTLDEAMLSEGLDHALIVSPEVLRLVRRSGDGPRLGSLDVSLLALRELEDADSLSATYRLMSAASFTPGSDGRRPLDVLEDESRQHSAKVSSELKGAVFHAAEALVAAFLRDIPNRPDAFGDHQPSLTQVRDAAFLTLYRLLFVLYAESRDERLATHRLYRDSYSLEELIGSLLEIPFDSLAANRTRLWNRVQVLFRVFNEGLSPNLPDLDNIPPRGGRLFSETTSDGALLKKLQLDDRACADVLLSLATTRPRRGVGRERVSFRELEIEQLGSVYEGLLEYEPAIAEELRLLVSIGGKEMVLTPLELLAVCEKKNLALSGDPALVHGTAAETLHPANYDDEDDTDAGEDEDEEDAEADSDGDVAIKSGAPARLLRRLEPGTFYFRAGAARKASGSFYTPTPMVDFLVREALGPLVEGKVAQEIEQLRVVDLACGSAHFLVGAARFLGARLHAAYRDEYHDEPPPAFAPPGTSRETMRVRWNNEGSAWCKRRIVERCLYGVDLNPAAVQLAQVALWIESLAGDRPLSFFAHHVRVGNSLQGTFAQRFDSPPDPQLVAGRRDVGALGLFESNIRARIEAALAERRLIDADLPPEIRADTPEEFLYKEDRLRRSEASLAEARLLMDLRSAAPYVPAIWPDFALLSGMPDAAGAARVKAWWPAFERVRDRERFFHWELEFPEVMLRLERPGFDAVLGNPPWDKVLPSKREFYADIDPLVVMLKGNELDQRIRELQRVRSGLADDFEAMRERTTTFARVLRKGGDFPLAKPAAEVDEDDGVLRRKKKSDQSAHEDLAKYFVDRSLRLAREGGCVGLVVPAVVYNGDGSVGIRQHLLDHSEIRSFYAFENRRRIFPIHASYKFANLVAQMGDSGAGAFDAAFMRHDVAELASNGPKPWMVRVTRDEVEKLSPETLAILEFRGPRDQEIVRKMSAGRPTFGGDEPGAWGTRMFTDLAHELIYNATRDRDLFTIPGTARLHSPESVLGARAPREPQALVRAMQDAGFWPVYEGKHIEQFLVGTKPVRWWLSVEQATAKYEKEPRDGKTLVFRETASNTNQRTCIAAVLPAKTAASHTCTAAEFDAVDSEAALSVLNSLCFDFLLRLRSAGTHVSFTYINPVAVPPAAATAALPRIQTRVGVPGSLEQLSDDRSSWPELFQLDVAVAKAYGIGPQEFAHILQAFPVWSRKRSDLAGYYREQLSSWRP